jgi:hypothetical protein
MARILALPAFHVRAVALIPHAENSPGLPRNVANFPATKTTDHWLNLAFEFGFSF